MAKILELLNEDYRIANNISPEQTVTIPSDYISKFNEKYKPFLSNFPEGTKLRTDAILKIKEEIKHKHDNGETLLNTSGQIDDNKFNEIKVASCKELKAIYPNIDFTNLNKVSEQYQQQYSTQTPNETITNKLVDNKTVNFNNPEEKAKYFHDLYNGLSKCKTREEKIKQIENGFGISLENMSDKEKDEVISKFEIKGKINTATDNIDLKQLHEENPNLNAEKLEQLRKDIAIKQVAMEINMDVKTINTIDDMMTELQNITGNIFRLEQKLSNCNDKKKIKELQNEITKLKNNQENIKEKLGLTNEEIKIINENFEKQTELEDEDLSDFFTTNENELEEDEDLSDLFTIGENELEEDEDLSDFSSIDENELKEDEDLSDFSSIDENELEEDEDLSDFSNIDENELEEDEDLSDLFNADKSELGENLETDEQPILKNNQIFVNTILTGADVNDLSQETINYSEITDDLKSEDYTMEVNEKKGLWNRIKNRFLKVKNTIIEKLNFKTNNKGQKYLDTAENNYKNVDEYAKIKNAFDESVIVSKEDQEKYGKEYQASKNAKQNNLSKIQVNNQESIKF